MQKSLLYDINIASLDYILRDTLRAYYITVLS